MCFLNPCKSRLALLCNTVRAAMPESCSCKSRELCRCEDESIDELAAFLGVGEAVAALTARLLSKISSIYPLFCLCLPASCCFGTLSTHKRLKVCQQPCSLHAISMAALACSLMTTRDMQCHGRNNAIPGGSESKTGPHAPIKAGRAGIPCRAPPAHKPR